MAEQQDADDVETDEQIRDRMIDEQFAARSDDAVAFHAEGDAPADPLTPAEASSLAGLKAEVAASGRADIIAEFDEIEGDPDAARELLAGVASRRRPDPDPRRR